MMKSTDLESHVQRKIQRACAEGLYYCPKLDSPVLVRAARSIIASKGELGPWDVARYFGEGGPIRRKTTEEQDLEEAKSQ